MTEPVNYDEWIAAVYDFPPPDPDGKTIREWAALWGRNHNTAGEIIKKAVAKGMMAECSRPGTRMRKAFKMVKKEAKGKK